MRDTCRSLNSKELHVAQLPRLHRHDFIPVITDTVLPGDVQIHRTYRRARLSYYAESVIGTSRYLIQKSRRSRHRHHRGFFPQRASPNSRDLILRHRHHTCRITSRKKTMVQNRTAV
ncbi:Uncharacterized protein Rs2_28271 [Raphanus sativus]|nr:Uncharacterized protein Rs2_28271 [Raphanus sativus]